MNAAICLLRELATGRLDAESHAALKKAALKIGSQFWIYEGLVAKKIGITFHEDPRTRESMLEAVVAEELTALPPASLGAQQ
jgi:hypothetical protein